MLDAGAESCQYHCAGSDTKITTGRFEYRYQRKREKRRKKVRTLQFLFREFQIPNIWQYVANVGLENPARLTEQHKFEKIKNKK